MSENTGKPVQLFYCYSHTDKAFRNELDQHLSRLYRSRLINTWYDLDIMPGDVWEEKINRNLDMAQIILLLVSADFIASDYCYSREIQRALERHAKGEARVIPIIVHPVDWKGTPFSLLQALPQDGQPITLWSNRDQVFADVARGIEKVARELLSLKESAESQFNNAGDVVFLERSSASLTVQRSSASLISLQKIILFLIEFVHNTYVAFYSGSASVSRFCGFNAIALKAAEHAIDLERNVSRQPRLYLSKGRALFNLKRYSEALDAYNTAIHLDSNLSQAYRSRGKVYAQLAQQAYDESQRLSQETSEVAISEKVVELENEPIRSTTHLPGTQQDAHSRAHISDRIEYQVIERLVQTYYGEILKYVSEKVPEKDARDVTQECFARITASLLPRGKEIKNERAWLYAITRNCIADYYVSQKKKPL